MRKRTLEPVNENESNLPGAYRTYTLYPSSNEREFCFVGGFQCGQGDLKFNCI